MATLSKQRSELLDTKLVLLLDNLGFLLVPDYLQGLQSARPLVHWRPDDASYFFVCCIQRFYVVALLVDVPLLQTAPLMQNSILVLENAVQVFQNGVALLHTRNYSLVALFDFIPQFKMVQRWAELCSA